METPVMFKMMRLKKEMHETGDSKIRKPFLAGIFHIISLDKLSTENPTAEIVRVVTFDDCGPLGYKRTLPLSFILEFFERCEIVSA